MPSKKLIVIGGPTASGKTALAIKIAKHFNTSIVNADSRQVYKELNIGVAKPDPAQLAQVEHYLIGHKSIYEIYNAGLYEKDALKSIDQIFQNNEVAVLSGGTGLYIKAVMSGLDEYGENHTEINRIRTELNNQYREEGLKSMADMLIELDPEAENTIAIRNPLRVLRALEQIKFHNKPLSEIRTGETKIRNFTSFNFYLHPDRNLLYHNINKRVDEMIEQGLESEARALYPFKDLSALQTVGYSELFEYFDGNLTREQAVDKIKQHTRNYAKRQVTYFKNVLKGIPLNPDTAENTIFATLNNTN